MAEFGGLGGIAGGRGIREADLFEAAVERALGDEIRESDELASEVWSALANVSWRHSNGDLASYSFRAAGDLVAAIRGSGDYMDWYCSGPVAIISEKIVGVMAAQGWSPENQEDNR